MEQFMFGTGSPEPIGFAPSAKADPDAAARAGHPHILVVDHDPAIRGLLSAYLTQNELRVTTVGNGAAMRALLGKQVIDLVVLALKLGEDSANARCVLTLRGAGYRFGLPVESVY